MAVKCPAGCGRKFISTEHAKAHADSEHPDWDKPELRKQKGWATPYGFADFCEPVTYDEACKQMKHVLDTIAERKRAKL